MNYLAHLRLSRPDTESMVGNLMGDFRKYLNGRVLPEKVHRGIENHVRVDKFTDSNQIICDTRRLFSHERRRFAGIIIDVTFDYFLIHHWQLFNDEAVDEFIDRTHIKLSSKRDLMPGSMQQAIDYMINENWLRSYSTLKGVDIALNRISRRIRFENKLAGAIEEIEMNYAKMEQGFLQFFPELRHYVESST